MKSISQLEVMRSEYAGYEFHFVLGGPTTDMSEITGIEISDVIVPNTLFKMRKRMARGGFMRVRHWTSANLYPIERIRR